MSLKGCTLYLATMDYAGKVWGGPPCTRCAVHVIQAGSTGIVTHPFKDVPSRWKEDIDFAKTLLEEAGISYAEIP